MGHSGSKTLKKDSSYHKSYCDISSSGSISEPGDSDCIDGELLCAVIDASWHGCGVQRVLSSQGWLFPQAADSPSLSTVEHATQPSPLFNGNDELLQTPGGISELAGSSKLFIKFPTLFNNEVIRAVAEAKMLRRVRDLKRAGLVTNNRFWLTLSRATSYTSPKARTQSNPFALPTSTEQSVHKHLPGLQQPNAQGAQGTNRKTLQGCGAQHPTHQELGLRCSNVQAQRTPRSSLVTSTDVQVQRTPRSSLVASTDVQAQCTPLSSLVTFTTKVQDQGTPRSSAVTSTNVAGGCPPASQDVSTGNCHVPAVTSSPLQWYLPVYATPTRAVVYQIQQWTPKVTIVGFKTPEDTSPVAPIMRSLSEPSPAAPSSSSSAAAARAPPPSHTEEEDHKLQSGALHMALTNTTSRQPNTVADPGAEAEAHQRQHVLQSGALHMALTNMTSRQPSTVADPGAEAAAHQRQHVLQSGAPHTAPTNTTSRQPSTVADSDTEAEAQQRQHVLQGQSAQRAQGTSNCMLQCAQRPYQKSRLSVASSPAQAQWPEIQVA